MTRLGLGPPTEGPIEVRSLIQQRGRISLTFRTIRDIEAFEGIGTRRHQPHHPPDVFLVAPSQVEFSEVKTVRWVKQSARGVCHPQIQKEFKGPVNADEVNGTTVDATNQVQVLKKGEGTDKVENL